MPVRLAWGFRAAQSTISVTSTIRWRRLVQPKFGPLLSSRQVPPTDPLHRADRDPQALRRRAVVLCRPRWDTALQPPVTPVVAVQYTTRTSGCDSTSGFTKVKPVSFFAVGRMGQNEHAETAAFRLSNEGKAEQPQWNISLCRNKVKERPFSAALRNNNQLECGR